jgi:hypothetical protein
MNDEFFTIKNPSQKHGDVEDLNIFKTSIYVSLFVNEINERDIIKYFKGIFSDSNQSSIYKFLFLSDQNLIDTYLEWLCKVNFQDLDLKVQKEFPREYIKQFLSQSFVSLSKLNLKDENEYKKEFVKVNRKFFSIEIKKNLF